MGERKPRRDERCVVHRISVGYSMWAQVIIIFISNPRELSKLSTMQVLRVRMQGIEAQGCAIGRSRVTQPIHQASSTGLQRPLRASDMFDTVRMRARRDAFQKGR